MLDQEVVRDTAGVAKGRIVAVYFALLLMSVLSFIGINAFMISNTIDEQRDAFQLQANEAYQHLLQVTQSTNYLLDGFSALVSGMGLTNYAAIVQYSDQVLSRVPHIYQIQMAQRVRKEDLKKANEDFRLFSDFSVRVFDGTDLIDASEHHAKVFYPISFVSDREVGSYSNLGIDIMSFPFLAPYVEMSANKRITVISEPFENLDEEQVFVMVQPAYFEDTENPDFYTFLLIKSDILQNLNFKKSSYGIEVRASGHDGHLFFREDQPVTSSIWMLPYFEYEQAFEIGAQTLKLKVVHQMQWSEINLTVLVVLWSGASLVLLSFFVMFRLHFKSEVIKLQQSELLYEMANFDALTHLANRRNFNESLVAAITQATRRNGRFGLMYLDLDGFKLVNDKYGHDAGDEVLRLASDKIKSSVREADLVGRLGGDEFAVILSDISNDEDCSEVRKRITAGIESITKVGDYSVELGTSIGVALFPNDAKSAEELLTIADERMYEHKRSKKAKSFVRTVPVAAS